MIPVQLMVHRSSGYTYSMCMRAVSACTQCHCRSKQAGAHPTALHQHLATAAAAATAAYEQRTGARHLKQKQYQQHRAVFTRLLCSQWRSIRPEAVPRSSPLTCFMRALILSISTREAHTSRHRQHNKNNNGNKPRPFVHTVSDQSMP
jgi:predicted component of type VI protein secretion system